MKWTSNQLKLLRSPIGILLKEGATAQREFPNQTTWIIFFFIFHHFTKEAQAIYISFNGGKGDGSMRSYKGKETVLIKEELQRELNLHMGVT